MINVQLHIGANATLTVASSMKVATKDLKKQLDRVNPSKLSVSARFNFSLLETNGRATGFN